MSRIGKKPIDLPESVSITLNEQKIIVKGNHGLMELSLVDFLKFEIENNKLYISRKEETAKAREFHGLLRAIIQNMVLGVTKKFVKTLIAEGVGYKFQVEKKKLIGHQKYEEWLELQKHGRYLSTKGATKVIPKKLITMHDAEFDTIRKNKKIVKNFEDLDIDLTIEGKQLKNFTSDD
jgi:large subunit ribosomal protein L6